MSKQFLSIFLLSLSGLLLAPPVIAQESEPALPPAADLEEAVSEEEVPAGQEVEINEDNYRQFMELKDANLQREIIPENVFKPGSGLQKLEKLPEESQKHLRNQLREIIVQGDPWQPGDEETEYPYTPSVAASTDPSLEKQELEAWGELVDSYHDRESQIYENSSGTQAARGSEQGSSNSTENGKGSTGSSGQSSEGSQGQQAGKEGNADESDTEGTYSLNGSGNPDANSTAGVSQNAMEFLQGLGKGSSNSGTGQQGNTSTGGKQSSPRDSNASMEANEAQANEPSEEPVDGQMGNQDAVQEGLTSDTEGEKQDDLGDEQSQPVDPSDQAAPSTPPVSTSQVSTTPPEEESTVGASQNALEYLTGESAQNENEMEETPDTSSPEGTLTIQDLLNAQGTGNSTDLGPVATDSIGDKEVDENIPDKDG